MQNCIVKKKNELIELISEYLENRASLENLQLFSWEMIEYFSKSKKTELPPYQDFEQEFWYTIWQIQHLADKEHEKEGITRTVLLEALDFLKKKKEMTKSFIGLRPSGSE
jgi:hypothetical protein